MGARISSAYAGVNVHPKVHESTHKLRLRWESRLTYHLVIVSSKSNKKAASEKPPPETKPCGEHPLLQGFPSSKTVHRTVFEFTLFERLRGQGISPSAEGDQGRRPLDPCEPLKRLDLNF